MLLEKVDTPIYLLKVESPLSLAAPFVVAETNYSKTELKRGSQVLKGAFHPSLGGLWMYPFMI